MFRARKGSKWELAAHHHLLSAALMRVYAGQTKRLIINIPPRYSKTEFVVNFIAWALGQYPDSEFIYTSYSARLAAKSSWDCREIVSHPEYRRIFPNVRLRDDSSAKDEWRTTAGGMVYAVGSGGTITGYGAGKMRPGFGGAIIVDDPHKADEATSEVMRANVVDWFQNTLESRLNSPETPIIIIMQRLHEGDLSGWLLDGKNGEKWDTLILPAIREDGSALWPSKHSIDRLRQMEHAAPYHFSGQYLQDPSPLAGGMFDVASIGIVDYLPPTVTDDLIRARAWDFAYSEGHGDYTASALGVIDRNASDLENVLYILEVTEARVRNPLTEIAECIKLDGRDVHYRIPRDPGGGNRTADEAITLCSGRCVGDWRPTAKKESTWIPLASWVNAGRVRFLRGPWNQRLLDQMRMAPRGKNDDMLDACTEMYGYLSQYGSGEMSFGFV